MSDNSHTQGTTNCMGHATKLIVNYLPRFLTQEELHEMFSSIGEVESCVLMCDKITFASLCYGFVEYFRPKDAANAIKSFDRLKIGDKILKVAYARPSSKAIVNANLYVRGLPKEFTQSDFEKLFSPYGKIIESRILCDKRENCCSREIGFLRFNTRAEAEKAVEKLNGALVAGVIDKPLIVKFSTRSEEYYKQQAHMYNNMNPRDQRSCGHYMNSIPQSGYNTMNPNHYAGEPFYMKSNNIGMNRNIPVFLPSLASCSSMQPMVQYSPGDALYNQATNSQLSTQMQAPQNYNAMQGSPLVHSQLPGYDTKNNLGWCLFVLNLPPDMDENALRQLFSNYGVVSGVTIIRRNMKKGGKIYGFVTMVNYFQAVTAIHWLNGFTINNYQLCVEFQKKTGSPKNNNN